MPRTYKEMQTLDTQGEGERKLHNDLSKQPSKEVQIPNKRVLKWLMSVATRESQIKASLKFHLT